MRSDEARGGSGDARVSPPVRVGTPPQAVEAGRQRAARGAPPPPLLREGPPPHAGKEIRALVTVARSGNRVCIAAACPHALAQGLVPGMALTQARAQMPDIDVRDADPEGDHADLQRLAILAARRWSPIVTIEDEDMLLLDISGVAHLFGGESALACRIVRLLARFGMTARIAIADTPGAAAALVRYAPQGTRTEPVALRDPRMFRHPRDYAHFRARGTHSRPPPSNAIHVPPPHRRPRESGGRVRKIEEGAAEDSRFRGNDEGGWNDAGRARDSGSGHYANNILICPPGAHVAAIATLPPEALRIDVEPVELLRRLGIDTIGALAAMPRGPLVRRFGAAIARRLDQASGRLPEPLDPVVPPAIIAAAQRFAEPVMTAEAIGHWLGMLVPRLAAALEKAGLGARRIELVADRVDHVPQRIAIGLARATRDPAHILRLIARRIETIEPGYGIDAMTLHVRRAEPLGPRAIAESLDPDAPPDIAPLVDALANRIGGARLWRTAPVESDVPERSVALCPPLDPPAREATPLRRDDVRLLSRDAPLPPWHAAWPRPVRLLKRPERLGDVIALMPDHPPRRFTWRGTTHKVVRADGPERVHGEWWKRREETQAIRDYFRVEDERGRRFWLFRKGDGERSVSGDLSWYLHGLFG